MGELDPVSVRGRAIALSPGLRKIETLAPLLDSYELVFGRPKRLLQSDVVIAWGRRPSAGKASAFATEHGLKLLYVEDGLIRSVGLGREDPPLSLMVDDQGIYYDASVPTRLESLISNPLSDAQKMRAASLILQWRLGEVSKYNYQRDAPLLSEPYVLVVDQTQGDASISAGCADESSFKRMLDAAVSENPDAHIVVKVHPEVARGRKRGHFDLVEISRIPRVSVISDDRHPVSLLKNARSVYVVSSQLGVEALMWGKKLRVFGMPFYASWGLTDDELPRLARRRSVALENLVHAAFVDYSSYVNPEDFSACGPEEVISWISLQRKSRSRFNDKLNALNFSGWKRPIVRDFFEGSDVRFVSRIPRTAPLTPLVVWGRKHDELLKSRSVVQGEIIRLEDGFLRSVGLGAHLTRPLSWVQDHVGIYYDATRPSGLEMLLANYRFDDLIRNRAANLRKKILSSGLTKYNVGSAASWLRPDVARKVVLVPGQVEGDASIKFGCVNIKSNLELLKAVRAAEPDAFIVYKPHPDVAARLRSGGQEEHSAPTWCDVVLGDVSMDTLLSQVDEVHTITSLTGFEALLRGVRVVTYGQPFYAGWGLTWDVALTEATQIRRSRNLSLDELVAATLLLYPTYISRVTRRFTTPERAVQELISWQKETPTVSGLRRIMGLFFSRV